MSPRGAVTYLKRHAQISCWANSGTQTRDAIVMLSIADLIQQLESENAELRLALNLSGQILRNSIGREDE